MVMNEYDQKVAELGNSEQISLRINSYQIILQITKINNVDTGFPIENDVKGKAS